MLQVEVVKFQVITIGRI